MKQNPSDILRALGATPVSDNLDAQSPMASNMPRPSLLDKARNIANTTRIPAAGAGITQGLYDTTKSVADMMPGMSAMGLAGNATGGKSMKLPNIDLSQYVPQDAISQTVFQGGKIASGIAGDTGLYKLAGKIPGLASQELLPTIGRGAAAAYAGGEEQPGGRGGAALLGGALGPISELGSKSIANRISGYMKGLQEELSDSYNSIFKQASDRGIKKVSTVPMNIDAVKNFADSKDVLESIKTYQDNPTLLNAHRAQSDLGKMQNLAQNSPKYKSNTAMDSYKRDVQTLGNMRSDLQNSIHSQLNAGGASDLSDAYKQVGQRYATELAPYFQPKIKDYQNGKTTAPKMLQSLRSNGNFMQNAAPNHPDFLRQQLLKKYGKAGAKLAVGSGLTAAMGILGLKAFSDTSGGNQ